MSNKNKEESYNSFPIRSTKRDETVNKFRQLEAAVLRVQGCQKGHRGQELLRFTKLPIDPQREGPRLNYM